MNEAQVENVRFANKQQINVGKRRQRGAHNILPKHERIINVCTIFAEMYANNENTAQFCVMFPRSLFSAPTQVNIYKHELHFHDFLLVISARLFDISSLSLSIIVDALCVCAWFASNNKATAICQPLLTRVPFLNERYGNPDDMNFFAKCLF